ncbi:hypothetical protein GCM10010191_68950 [Actinomadura vinacea]|uniref:Uncharacterized protein n=1 Tax=Actinomadura vinacea TaxID=115336 RepID=A0ABN3K0K4_9ACTN
MVDPPVPERLLKGLRDVLLPLELGERRRPVLAVQRQGHRGSALLEKQSVRSAGVAFKPRDPPHTRQSLLILAAFRPWGGSQDDAVRGVCPESMACEELRKPLTNLLA